MCEAHRAAEKDRAAARSGKLVTDIGGELRAPINMFGQFGHKSLWLDHRQTTVSLEG